MSAVNKLSKDFQIVVPKYIREALNVHEDDSVEWILNKQD